MLRFSNLVFEHLWSRNFIRNVQLIFSEDSGTEGHGRSVASLMILLGGILFSLEDKNIISLWFIFVSRYFDNYGIIRDIMQNHLLQILALFAIKRPVSLDSEDVGNEKVMKVSFSILFTTYIIVLNSISSHHELP